MRFGFFFAVRQIGKKQKKKCSSVSCYVCITVAADRYDGIV